MGGSFIFNQESYQVATSSWGKKNESPGIKNILSVTPKNAKSEYIDNLTPRKIEALAHRNSSNMQAVLTVPRLS